MRYSKFPLLLGTLALAAAHGYGPVVLAGAEVLLLCQGKGASANINDNSVPFAPSPANF